MFQTIRNYINDKKKDEYKYPSDYAVIKIEHQGNIHLFGETIYLNNTIKGEKVGLKKLDAQNYEIYFEDILYATFDRISSRIVLMYGARNLRQD